MALGLTHIHPDVLITVTPPALGSAYMLYRRNEKKNYNELLGMALLRVQDTLAVVNVPQYDETDIKLALKGIDSEFDYFLSVVLPKIEGRIVDYLVKVELEGKLAQELKELIDENGQVNVHLSSSPETFVSLKAEYPGRNLDLDLGVNPENNHQTVYESAETPIFSKFISFSVALYDSKDTIVRKRLGAIQVSMLQDPRSENDQKKNVTTSEKYHVGIKFWPYAAHAQGIDIP